MKRWWRSPLLHFVAIGAALFVADRAWQARAGPPPLVVDAERVAALRSEWVRQTGRPPNEAELASLVARHVDDELLIREAMALGWHRTDPVVRRRLIRNQRFLEVAPGGAGSGEARGEAGDEAGSKAWNEARDEAESGSGGDIGRGRASDEELLEAAYAMGMDESDLVVRRRLLSRAQLAISARARAEEPSDTELAAHLALHPDRFRRPEQIRLTHVFLSRDRRGEALEREGRALVAALRREDLAPERATERGDPFLVPADLPLSSADRLAAQLGGAFADGLLGLPTGAWSGPVPSSYGMHAVWIHERVASEVPPLKEIRKAVRADLLVLREQLELERMLERLRAGVEVRVEAEGSEPAAAAAADAGV